MIEVDCRCRPLAAVSDQDELTLDVSAAAASSHHISRGPIKFDQSAAGADDSRDDNNDGTR